VNAKRAIATPVAMAAKRRPRCRLLGYASARPAI
jgi:hypothetical protein